VVIAERSELSMSLANYRAIMEGTSMDLPPLVDTHAHLTASDYDEDRDGVVRRASEEGLRAIITVGFEPGDWHNTLDLTARYPTVFAALGIHPNNADQANDEAFALLYDLCSKKGDKPVVALGETGLDFYREHVSHEAQRASFRAHLRLARELDLPVVIHNRDAHADILAILESDGVGTRGVMHSASGDLDFARRCMALDYMISLAGPVTFKRAADKHALATDTPLDMLMVETDCPYLTPEPYRGRRNEPAYVKYTAQAIATLRGLPYAEVAHATTQNASCLFNLNQQLRATSYELRVTKPEQPAARSPQPAASELSTLEEAVP
jgi:TatD DNase family protein